MTSSETSAIHRYLQGGLPLWVVFWLGYVLPVFSFAIVYALLFSFAFSAAPLSPIFLFAQPIIMLVAAIFLGFTYLAMWRSAMNVSLKFLGYLARGWVVVHGLYFLVAFARTLAAVPQLVAAIA